MAEANREYIDINTFQDIEMYFDKLTKGENVAIGNISDVITVAIKLDGGRFANYEPPYVNAVIANMILAHQEAYKKIVKQLQQDYGVTDLDEEILLQFKLEQGCCEAELKEFNNILETIKTMEPQMQLVTIGAILLGLFGYGAYRLIKQKMVNNKEIALSSIQNNHTENTQIEQNRHTEAIIGSIEKITRDYKLERAVNSSKEKTLKYLNADENLSYEQSGRRSELVTKHQINNYDVEIVEEQQQEIESIEIITGTVSNKSYGTGERKVKFNQKSLWFNRDLLPVEDGIKLETKANSNEPINVEVKLFKNEKGDILRAYLLRVVD